MRVRVRFLSYPSGMNIGSELATLLLMVANHFLTRTTKRMAEIQGRLQ